MVDPLIEPTVFCSEGHGVVFIDPVDARQVRHFPFIACSLSILHLVSSMQRAGVLLSVFQPTFTKSNEAPINGKPCFLVRGLEPTGQLSIGSPIMRLQQKPVLVKEIVTQLPVLHDCFGSGCEPAIDPAAKAVRNRHYIDHNATPFYVVVHTAHRDSVAFPCIQV